MKKLFFLLLFLPLCLSAQTPKTTIVSDSDSLSDTLPHRNSYMSFFGKNKTEWSYVNWVIYDSPILTNNSDIMSEQMDYGNPFADLSGEDTDSHTILLNQNNTGKLSIRLFVFLAKNISDTFTYNGHLYRGIVGRDKGFIREDTLNGRLYRLYHDSIEALWCDMSLMLGDTFKFPDEYTYYGGRGRSWRADSVFYLDHRKIIRFELIRSNSIYATVPWWYYALTLYFIEGIGPVSGPLGDINANELPLLLCVYKDDTLDFMTSSAWGCDIKAGPGWFYDAVKEPKRTTLTLQPNPAQDYILLRNEDASDLGGEIIITDAIGRVMRHCTMENAEMRISTGSYGYGTYFVRYRSQNGVQTLKFVKVQ